MILENVHGNMQLLWLSTELCYILLHIIMTLILRQSWIICQFVDNLFALNTSTCGMCCWYYLIQRENNTTKDKLICVLNYVTCAVFEEMQEKVFCDFGVVP